MDITIDIAYTQQFLPTRRHRKPRSRDLLAPMAVSIDEVTEENFPLAFRITDYKSLYTGKYGSGKTEYRLHDEDIRVHDGRLFAPYRGSYGAALCEDMTPVESVNMKGFVESEFYWLTNRNKPYPQSGIESGWDEKKSVVLSDDLEESRNAAKKAATRFVVFEGNVWAETSEPMYVIITFGLGHNHGGTGFFVENFYNENIPHNNYFTAMERDQAVKYFNDVATRRGDTDSVGIPPQNIQVFMPEMVKRCPARDHGDGDPFMNQANAITEAAPDALTAGLLVMGLALK